MHSTTLGEIDRVALQIRERAIVERAQMRRAQDDARRALGFERLLPARRAEAPAIARDEAGKAISRHRRREIVADRFREGQEFCGRDDADRVAADIIRTGIATAIAIKPGHRMKRAILQHAAEHVERGTAAAAAATGIEGHRVLPLEHGADAQIRTADLLITNEILACQLTS